MNAKLVRAFIAHNLRFFLLLVLCSAICFSVFVTFHSVQLSLDAGLGSYLEDYAYYDGLMQPYYGTFTADDVETVRNISGISKIDEAYLTDSVLCMGDNTRYVRLAGLDVEKYPLYKLEEADRGDICLSAEFASSLDLHAGDTITVRIGNNEFPLAIRAIINSPYFIGATRSITPTLETSSLGYAYIAPETLSKYADVSLPNTIIYFLTDDADPVEVRDCVLDYFADRQLYFEETDNRHAVETVKNDLDTLRPVATVLPMIIYLVGLVICVLFLRQFMEIKSRDIGILRSNGVSDREILGIFVRYSLWVSVTGCVLGIVLSLLQSRIYTNFYTDAIFVPQFSLKMDAVNIVEAAALTVIITIAAVLINIRQITSVDVVQIMNGESSSSLPATSRLMRLFPVGVRPFVSTAFMKPAKFIFSLVNIVLVCMIVTASFGVRNAKDNSIDYVFDKEIHYDYTLHYYMVPGRENNGDNSYCDTYAEVNGHSTRLFVLNNTDYLHIYDENEAPLALGNGIIIYSDLANELGVKAGERVTLNGQEITVDAVCKEVTDYKCYMSFPVYEELFRTSRCNVFFIKGEMNADDYAEEDGFFYVGSVSSLRNDLNSKFSFISRYILIIVGLSCLICVIVIYNLSVIFYRDREREHMIMRTLGYSHWKVLLGSLIEILLQSVLALAVGLPLGYLLASYTANAISNGTITMYISFADIPVMTVVIFILCTAVIGRIAASRGQIRLLPSEF